MTEYELYTFLLCLIVFLLFTAVFTAILCLLVKSWLKCINNGLEDDKVYKEYSAQKNKSRKKPKAANAVCNVFFATFCVLCAAVFALAFVQKANQKSPVGKVPVPKVVVTGSMSEKIQSNEYLYENDLNNQIQTFDIVLIHKMPSEFDLKLYDIVAYENSGTIVFHRIVEIEEPNESHDHRHFKLQGDAVQYPDVYPVMYEQMLGIYQNERVPYIGSFVLFLQSPAGILCFILLLFYAVAEPIAERKISRAEQARLAVILAERGREPADESGEAEEQSAERPVPVLVVRPLGEGGEANVPSVPFGESGEAEGQSAKRPDLILVVQSGEANAPSAPFDESAENTESAAKNAGRRVGKR